MDKMTSPGVMMRTSEEDHVVITGATTTQPEAVPAEAATEAALVVTTGVAPEITTEVATEVSTPEVSTPEVSTPEVLTLEVTTQSMESLTTGAAAPSPAEATEGVASTLGTTLVVETAAPTTAQEADTKTAENNVVVEDEGLSSGQVVGIVIGALIAVIIVIAVVIALVRRMGKYSSAKKAKIVKRKRTSRFL
ncbi:hypothetical protein NHX12_012789 [Muraenolepis orangiensis]|uniref:Podoplanin n=1 Tax=Muraenolepis orangiensis TaxID=630683 RepID=A0A9Q0I7F5_9TELE|nr:hypothetical protein NHX12_012789 [Muraenolepis orangiensis]